MDGVDDLGIDAESIAGWVKGAEQGLHRDARSSLGEPSQVEPWRAERRGARSSLGFAREAPLQAGERGRALALGPEMTTQKTLISSYDHLC